MAYRSPDLDFDPVGVPVDFIPRQPGIDVGFIWKLAQYIEKQRPNVLHAYNDTAIFYAVAAATLQIWDRPKLVGTFHTWPSHPTAGAKVSTRWACNRANHIVAVSMDLRARLLKSHWVQSCTVISNGVDLRNFQSEGPTDNWRARLGASDDAILVGHIARFDEIKRHRDLIDAARMLKKAAPKIIIACVGQGKLLAEIKWLAKDCDNVRFISHATPTAPFLRSLDIFVLCSQYEAAPLVLLEAMACSVSIVATSVGGIPDIVGNHNSSACAIQVSPCNPEELAAALANLARDRSLRAALAERAKQRAVSYSFDSEWLSYSNLYIGR